MRPVHLGDATAIVSRLETLGLSARVLSSATTTRGGAPATDAAGDVAEVRTLCLLLAINELTFLMEMA